MKEKILLFLKGSILGLSFILPGISGGVLSISLGLYDKLIYSVSHFFDKFKENFKFLFTLGLGAFVSIALSVLILDKVFYIFPLAATLLFLGLILGGIPGIFDKVKKSLNVTNTLIFVIGFTSILLLATLGGDGSKVLNSDFLNLIKLFFVGVLIAATIVVPGISGSFLLMAIGYYKPLLSIASQMLKFNNLIENIILMIPLGLGIIIGGFIIVKIIEYFMKQHEIKTYFFIMGIVFASILQVILSLFNYQLIIYELCVGIIVFALGALISLKFFKN